MREEPDAPAAASGTGRRRGRPRHQAATREGIATAALEVARSHGYERLTMAAVARRLGVAPSALYNHVTGKADLLALLQDEVMGEVEVDGLRAAVAGEVPVREAVRDWAHSYRRVFAGHTPLIPMIATLPIAGAEQTQRMYDAVAAALGAAGVAETEVLPRIIALESFIYGSAFDVHAPAHLFEVAAAPGELPAFQAAAAACRRDIGIGIDGSHATDEGPAVGTLGVNPYADDPFETGLELLLAGL
ncbi:TetR/AcrR family transcriptional regulator [Micrococcus sp. EYE_162]|uniref:TetR/AcrR family transcriptional regulator n=2 Tax=Micrococcus TaxID=1269 RepID=UPI00200460C7|nr:TetR/AcrR family transcriptional regulator [Micrococcus sp. EYE_212]MCK6172576.1 TetR/AcrR family transcriptional regulator [Micrococcus sp. EYE_162]